MIKRHFLRAFILIVLLGCLALPAPAFAQGGTSVGFAPAEVSLGVGAEIDLALDVQDVNALYGFDITFTFDPNLLEVIDVDPSGEGVQAGLGTFLDAGFIASNKVDNQAGEGHVVFTQLNPSEPKSGSGNLLVVRLRAKQEGRCALEITSVQLATNDGQSIPVSVREGSLTVSTSAQEAPAAPSIPMQAGSIPAGGTPAPAAQGAGGTEQNSPTPAAAAETLPAQTAAQAAGPTEVSQTAPLPEKPAAPQAEQPTVDPNPPRGGGFSDWLVLGLSFGFVLLLAAAWLLTRKKA